MGLALIRIQKAEQVLKMCLTHFLPGQEAALESLENREEALRRQMLGKLIGKLKERLNFDPDFENVLANFLADRNMFVHNFFGVSGFSLETDDEVAIGIDFVRKLVDQAVHVTNIVMGINKLVLDAHDPDRKPIDPLNVEEFNKIMALMVLRPKSERSPD